MILRHVSVTVFQSLHRLLFHSSFTGNLPSIMTEAKKDVSNIFSGHSKLFAMLPLMNVTAKGVMQFIFNIGSSIGGNIFKIALGTRKSDKERYIDQLNFYYTIGTSRPFQVKLSTLNAYQASLYLGIPQENELLLYFDECGLEIEGRNHSCHLIILSHTLKIVYEAYKQLRVLEFNYKNIRKV